MTRAHLPLLLAAALAGGALVYGFDGYPLLEPDEGRNAEVAREMAASNDYVLPRLNGLPYLDKPVLYFAAGALSIEMLGPTELAARLPSLAFTLLTLAVTVRLARRLYGAEGAWIAGVAFLASPFTLAYARTVILDSAVTLWMTLAIAAFWIAAERRGGEGMGAARWWAVTGWAAIGLGVLTKGPVALAVPLLVTIPYAAWRGRLGAVLEPLGLLALLAVVLPWVFAVSGRIPDFLHYALVVETGQRLTQGLGRAEAWWYFFPVLLGAALPWSVVVLAGLARRPAGSPDPRAVLLVLWIAAPLLLFTLSASKRPQYVLPLVPAFALAVSHLWHRARGGMPGAALAGGALGLLGAALVLGAGRLPGLFPAAPDVAALIPRTARVLGAVVLAAGLAAVALARRRDWVLLALAAPVCAIPLVGLPLLAAIGRDRSSADLAAAIRPVMGEGTEIVTVGTYPLSLPFYLRRTLTLATADGRELTSNYVTRRMDLLRLLPAGTLRPPAWWQDALTFCDRPRLFVARAEAGAVRRQLELALPLVAMSRKVAVYGPCGSEALAHGGEGSGEGSLPVRGGRPAPGGDRSPLPAPR